MRENVARPLALLIAALIGFAVPATPADQDRKLNRRDIEKLAAEADKLAAEGQFAAARERLDAIVRQDPTNALAALKLARVCESLSDWACAGGAYQIAATNAQGADRADALAGLAAAHWRAGRDSDAAQNARAAIDLNPSLAAAHVTLAASLARQGAPGAASAARKAVELAPSSDTAHVALGQSLASEDKYEEAEAAFARAIELQPKSVEAYSRLTDIRYRKKDFDGVIASAGAALALDKSLGHLYSIRGRAYHQIGKEDEALNDLQHAVALEPNDREAQLALGHIYRTRKNLDLAAAHYKKAASDDLQPGEPHLGLADVLVARHDFEAAREPVERVAASLPRSAQAQYLLGMLREHQQQYDEAARLFQQAAALDPGLTAAHLGLGRVLREHKKDAAAAVQALEKAIALEPDNPQVLSELGVALYETKQADRAIDLLQKAVATSGYDNAMGFAVLGLALKDRQDFAVALGHFEKAIELAPKWWLPYWGAAWSHFGLIKKGCPCDEADDERVKKMKASFDSMTNLQGKDPALETRVDALLKGQKVK